LAEHAALVHAGSMVLNTEPSGLIASTLPVTALLITFMPEPSKSANRGGATPSPTKSIDWS
jgi:hypothetical protein